MFFHCVTCDVYCTACQRGRTVYSTVSTVYTRDVNRAGNFGPARPANFFSGPARPGINLIQNWYCDLKKLLYL